MNNYTITEDSLHYKKPIYKKFNSLKDCKKWINNNLDNTKNYKVFNGLYYITIFNNFNYLLEEINQIRIKENYWNSEYIKQLMEDYNNE
jgi:hypothetical protein